MKPPKSPKWTERMTIACQRAMEFREPLEDNLTFGEKIDMLKIALRSPGKVPKQFRGKIKFERR